MKRLSFHRVTQAKYAASALTGRGASLTHGRWHRLGYPVVYASSSTALAILETVVNAADRADLITVPYCVVDVFVPAGLVDRIERADLPGDWQSTPPPASTQQIGAEWFDSGSSVGLLVPSTVVPRDWNVLLNPLHPDWHRVEVGEPEALPMDLRLGE
jgi:RES domain-containing protein